MKHVAKGSNQVVVSKVALAGIDANNANFVRRHAASIHYRWLSAIGNVAVEIKHVFRMDNNEKERTPFERKLFVHKLF